MTSEELYTIHNDSDVPNGEKITAWQEWCEGFEHREAERAKDAEDCKEYAL